MGSTGGSPVPPGRRPGELSSARTLATRAVGSVLICRFPERGCALSVSRSRRDTLRLVSDTAALHPNWDNPAVRSGLAGILLGLDRGRLAQNSLPSSANRDTM